ncbi:metallophosphoesterase family protein [Halorubrum vacuolatum]|uniref:DNA repair exonuclease SbcCD nuclease subunit n=1 Tax=Halorubrum vacuolatum TaxID=63740 RepID=A0A238YHQ7_HALVU|nr:DNA repair exonuclease [Halorubrum vacuolatum]SNR70251.1 DNA repair exonuclease SbcCD nuclease subunit [Halorubrum vacuolatum]
MGVRFLHAADLHLGSPLESVTDKQRTDELHRATHDALKRIISLAIDREVEFVVVSGDLYDKRARSVEANDFLVQQFERLNERDVPCYIVHGNHDPLYDGAERLDWPENVHVFSADGVEIIEHPGEEHTTARLLGQSYGQQWVSETLSDEYTPPDSTVPNIGLLHTGLNPDGRKYAPCSPSDLAAKEIDYWALGHIHTPGRIAGANAAYAGIPQGRHIGEAGVGGCYIVEVEPNASPELAFLPTSPVVWHEIEIDIGTAKTGDGKQVGTLSELVSCVVDRCQEVRNTGYTELAERVLDVPVSDVEWEPTGVIFRLNLVGRGAVHDQLDEEAIPWLQTQIGERLPSGTSTVWIESIRDRTSPPLPDDETLREEDETIDELHALVEELRTQQEVQQDLRETVGEVWEWTPAEETEDLPEDRLVLNEDRLDDLIDSALRRATDRIALEHYNVD